MSRTKGVRPALVVVVLALISAVAGTALAGSGPDANNSASLNKKLKKTTKKAKKALNKADANAVLLDELCGTGASAAGNATCTLPQGPTGPPGQNAAENIVARSESGAGLQSANCNAGERVVGGGAAAGFGQSLQLNGPNPISGTPTEWQGLAVLGDVQVIVLCGSP